MSGIEAITIGGYKSLASEQSIEIRPLTLLAGANSSGKSSVMQPLLLLKQTLEASYDPPGALLLDGPNVKFTSVEQMFTRNRGKRDHATFTLGIAFGAIGAIQWIFQESERIVLVREMTIAEQGNATRLRVGTNSAEVESSIPAAFVRFARTFGPETDNEPEWSVGRERCFLVATGVVEVAESRTARVSYPATEGFASELQEVIHVPGLRGNPERAYRTSAVGERFVGTFENYAASVIDQWQRDNDSRLVNLEQALLQLGLTSSIKAKRVNDTQVELHVGRGARRAAWNHTRYGKHRRCGLWRLSDTAGAGSTTRCPTRAARLHRTTRTAPPSKGSDCTCSHFGGRCRTRSKSGGRDP